MEEYLENTIIVSGPKRSGTTLINRLFDSHPGIIDLIDEAFFWEHVYDYQERGLEHLFVDIFRSFDPSSIADGISDRAILRGIDRIYRQRGTAYEQTLDLEFDPTIFISKLEGLHKCSSIPEIWNCLIRAYALASASDYSACRTAFIKAADYGKSILSALNTLEERCCCVFIIRNPYYAIDSLKKSRERRGEKLLHPFNLSEVIRDYLSFWKNKSAILGTRTKLIRFEDLCAKPEQTMTAVANHVGITYTDNLIQPTVYGKDWSGNSSFDKTSGIDPSILGRDIQVLTELEIAFIRKHLKELLEYFDYDL